MALTGQQRDDLLWVAEDYDRLLASVSPGELALPTSGTRWTNRELLFHMWFGQRIARAFVLLVGAFSRLPPRVSVEWSRVLTAVTRPYDWVNFAAPVIGAKVVGLERTRGWMRHDTHWLVGWGERASAEELGRGMSVPPSWDPYFSTWMCRADVLEWAPKHYRHHRAQLALRAVG